MLYDTVQSELEEKIRRLEEDRHSIDITSGQGRGVAGSHTASVSSCEYSVPARGSREEPSKE